MWVVRIAEELKGKQGRELTQILKNRERLLMGFKKDSKKAQSFDTVQPGEYEVFIEKAMADRSKAKGTPNISLRLKIRDDIDQSHAKQIIFHNVYLTPNTEGMVHGFLAAIDIDEGYEFEYDFVEDEFFQLADEIAKLVKGKATRVKTKIDTYNGNERGVVSSFKTSEVGGELEITDEGGDKPLDISDDDLPF